MLSRLLPVPLCYVAFSAKSQTLKVHPVASKTLTDLSRWRFPFSIFVFREPSDITTIKMDQLVQMDKSAKLLTHTHSASFIFLSCSSADFSAWTQPETAGHDEARPHTARQRVCVHGPGLASPGLAVSRRPHAATRKGHQ